jgi:hypothetical protein
MYITTKDGMYIGLRLRTSKSFCQQAPSVKVVHTTPIKITFSAYSCSMLCSHMLRFNGRSWVDLFY